MPFYETVFIARQDLSDAQVKAVTDACETIIKEAEGKIAKVENWGLRTLAYKINKNRKGHYVLIESEAPAPALHEVERTLRLNEDILRYMTIRLDEPTKGPSKIIDKSSDEFEGREGRFDRGDRPDRGDRENRGDRAERGDRDNKFSNDKDAA